MYCLNPPNVQDLSLKLPPSASTGNVEMPLCVTGHVGPVLFVSMTENTKYTGSAYVVLLL